MFTYSNIMRALKAGGVPDYWYAQFVVNDANAQTIGLAGRGVTVVSAGDVAYPVYLNTYNDAAQTAGTATHWYDLNADSNDGVGTAHGTDTDITYSGGGAVFNGTTSKITLPSSVYTAQWRTLEIVFELYAFDCLLFNLASSIAGNTFDIRITSSGSIRYRVSTAQFNESIGPSLRLNKKYYAVLTYNSTTGEILGYLDGRLAAQNTAITNGNHANGVSATIGMYSPLSNSFMNGTIYDLKLHSSALTPAQIKANAIAIGLYGEQLAGQDNIKVWHDKIAGDIYSKLTRYNYDDAAQPAGTATHWYKLNTDSNDSVGTAHGTDTDITYSGGGAVFNGTTSKISFGESGLSSSITGTVSIELVFKHNINPSDTNSFVVFGLNAARIGITVVNGVLKCAVRHADLSYTVFDSAQAIADIVYYVAVTVDFGSSIFKCYVNGLEKFSSSIPANYVAIGSGWQDSIGEHVNDSVDRFFTGVVYDLKVHNSIVLPATQIKANALAIGLYDGPIETEYASITADLKPASYDPADATLDTTSIIATNPDANDWQPYGA